MPTTVTIKQIQELMGALQALDGYTRVVKSGEQESQVRIAYKFSAELRKSIRRDINRLQPEFDAHNEVVKEIFRDISGGRDSMNPEKNPEDAKLAVQFSEEIEPLLSESVELNLIQLPESDLLVNDNPIPGSVLAALRPILKAEDDEVLPARPRSKRAVANVDSPQTGG